MKKKGTQERYLDTPNVQIFLDKLLNGVLCAGHRVQEAHWNVKGPAFGPLHELFGDIYSFLDEAADVLAERKVQLDGIAQVSFTNAPILGDDGTLLVQVVSLLNQLADITKDGICAAEASQDQLSVDIFVEFGRELEKWIWKVDSHLKQFQKVGSDQLKLDVQKTAANIDDAPIEVLRDFYHQVARTVDEMGRFMNGGRPLEGKTYVEKISKAFALCAERGKRISELEQRLADTGNW